MTGGSSAARYGVAVAAVGVVAAVKRFVDPLLGVESPFLLFVVAVMVAAWLGGAGPGLAATGLAALVGSFLFLPPPNSVRIDGFGNFVNLALFVVEGVVISAIVASMHGARRRSEGSAVRARRERERSERSEESFRLLLEGAKDYAILMLTPDGRVASWNEGARRILGYAEEEILGEPFAVFFTPEDRRDGLPERELETAIREGTASDDNWVVRKDGTRLWASGSTSLLRDEAGDLRGVVKVIQDRTEARRAEEELRLRDRAIAASANGIVISDPNLPDNPIVYVNPAFERMTGYAADEVVGRNCRFLQGEDRDQPGIGELRAAIREGRSCEVVMRNYRKDGSLFFNELSVSPVFGDDGGISRFVGIQDDVTERMEAQEELERSEERYRAVIEQSAEGIYLLDAESRRLLETNPSFQAMLGYGAEELRGMELYGLMAHSREDVDANIGHTLEAGRRFVGGRTYRRKDGALLDVEVGVSTISYNSHRAICATVRDVTARRKAEEALKRSEERFRSLVRYASDIIVVLDGSGEILFESPAVERVLGFTAAERMGANAFDYLHPEDRGPVADRFAKLSEEPGARISAEYRTRNKEGDWRSFEAIGVNLLDDPVIRGIVVNSRDVTERKRTEQALAEIRDAERGRIARELHDGVLQDLSYTAQAMEVTRVKYDGTGVESDLEEAAETVRRAARDLRESIYDLRVYRHGRQNVAQLFESLIDLNRRRMPGREIEADIEQDLFENLSERGGMELLRVVQEALTNVRRHSGARRARVALTSSKDTVRVEVSDDGRGFDPEALPPGVGTLGMRERALALGGRLEIESEPGSGTTVRFEAPPNNLRR